VPSRARAAEPAAIASVDAAQLALPPNRKGVNAGDNIIGRQKEVWTGGFTAHPHPHALGYPSPHQERQGSEGEN